MKCISAVTNYNSSSCYFMFHRFMTLMKDVKTPKIKAVPSKKKVPTKSKSSLGEKVVDEPKKTKTFLKDKNDNEEILIQPPEIETEVFENSNSSDDSGIGISDDKDDLYEPGPSSGKRMTDEQREEHLYKLQMIQRNMLRRFYLDDEDFEEEDVDAVNNDSYSRSA